MKLIRKISTGLLAALCLFTLSACQSNQQKQASEQKRVKKEDNTLPTGNYFEEDNQQKVTSAQRKKAIANVTDQMNQNYKSIGRVKSNGNTITLSLTGSQMNELVEADQQGNSQAKKFWRELTTGMTKTSKTLSSQLKDTSLTLKIMSTNNNLIYAANNGKVTTDKLSA